MNFEFIISNFSNDLRWNFDQMKVVDLKKLWKFVVFKKKFEIILASKITFEFLKFEIQILQMASDEKTYNTKVVDLEMLWNFIVDNFLIWIRLGPQTLNLLPVGYNMWGTETECRHMWWYDVVIVGGIVWGVGCRFETRWPR